MGTLHHNANPHPKPPFGIEYKTPRCQRMDRSFGHDVGLSSNCNDDHMIPANVTEIEVVREITKPIAKPVMDPYEYGMWAGERGIPKSKNPYSVGTNEYFEWTEGWEAA